MKTQKDLLVLKAGKTPVHARGYLATTKQLTIRKRAQGAEVGNLSGKKVPIQRKMDQETNGGLGFNRFTKQGVNRYTVLY